MNRIDHPDLPKGISRIGLGCARLNGGADRKLGQEVIETAIAMGITHFDTAPSYGFGLSERLLGSVIANDKGYSVATKVGIAPPSGGGARSIARKLLRPVLNGLPAVKQAMIGALGTTAAPRPQLTPDTIRQHLDNSRAALRRDEIELYMLHEPSQAVVADAAVLECFDALKTSGAINAFGVGIGDTFAQEPTFGQVVQSRWTMAGPASDFGKIRVYHGLFRHSLPRFRELLADRPQFGKLAETLDFDAENKDCHPAILLTAAMILRPRDVFLISSNAPDRLKGCLKGMDWHRIGSPSEKDVNASRALLSALEPPIESDPRDAA
ncbi:MAG: aldo/keto reductase [Pseudomonadota bacterium]